MDRETLPFYALDRFLAWGHLVPRGLATSIGVVFFEVEGAFGGIVSVVDEEDGDDAGYAAWTFVDDGGSVPTLDMFIMGTDFDTVEYVVRDRMVGLSVGNLFVDDVAKPSERNL